ncbi:MAG TPA: hypothetical protein VFJ43_16940, partial [Bacteroidia bacterium]|nr:hypothetical protein [Bacteroidia bacterium]
MRYFIPLLIFTSLLFSCGHVDIAHYSSFPDVMTVAKNLDNDYKVYGSTSVYFTLAKKPKGWFVERMDSKTFKLQSEEMYWS